MQQETCTNQLCNDMFGQKTALVLFGENDSRLKGLWSLTDKNEEVVLKTFKFDDETLCFHEFI